MEKELFAYLGWIENAGRKKSLFSPVSLGQVFKRNLKLVN